MLQLCRFYQPQEGARLGQVIEGEVYDLTATGLDHFASLAALLQASCDTPIIDLLDAVTLTDLPSHALADLDTAPTSDAAHLLPTADQQEIWAAGVTYAWSREARVREASTKDVYVKVYDADRPEIFFKSPGEKAVGPNDWVGLRGDSKWNVPEPELTLVVNPIGQIVGYTVGNDVSSRDIEGENPLYLPQAKMFRHACAVGPVIRIADTNLDVDNLSIQLTINRGGNAVVTGETSTAKIHRSLTELVEYLGRYYDFPNGALLLTGAGIVPDDEFTLQDGDEVLIEIEGIGILRNVVKQM